MRKRRVEKQGLEEMKNCINFPKQQSHIYDGFCFINVYNLGVSHVGKFKETSLNTGRRYVNLPLPTLYDIYKSSIISVST